MSERLFVGTRKGLFLYERGDGGTFQLRRKSFIGDPVTMVLPDARDGAVYVALDLGHFGPKLHRSDDVGGSWTELAVPEYPKAESEDAKKSLKLIWALESAGDDRPGGLWAGTVPGGLFRSRDRGESWELNRSLWEEPRRKEWFGGGFDEPGLHSICVDPNDSRHVLVGVSCGGVWATEDEAESWRCRTAGMYAEYMPPERREDGPIQDPHRVAQCPADAQVLWVQHHNGVFRSTDGGESFREIHPPVSKFGFAAAIHPSDPKTCWLVPLVKDECRVPVDGRVVVTRSRDGGESFEMLREGLPQEEAYDAVYRHGLDVDATGTRLAMGSTTGSLWLSEDQGDSWNSLSRHLPPVYCLRFG